VRFLALILCLVATAASADVTITPPPGPVPLGQFVILDLDGAGEAPQVLLAPKASDGHVDIGRHGDQPCVVFWADAPGVFNVLVLNSDRRAPTPDEYALATVVAGQVEPEPKPDPQPKPDPKPVPPPPPPQPAAHVWYVYESNDNRPETRRMRLTKVWPDAAEDAGMDWLRADDDDLAEVAPEAADAARETGLPAVVWLYEDKRVLSAMPAPTTVAEMIAEIEVRCPTCQPEPKKAAPQPQPKRWRLFRR
jgi:hypothetical protein